MVEIETLVIEALLMVELVLLAVSVVLLVIGRKESKSREELSRQMFVTTRVLTREEYFRNVTDAIGGAKSSIVASATGTLPSGGEEDRTVEAIFGLLKHARSRGVKVRYVVPNVSDRLYFGYKLKESGCDVRYNKGLIVYDLRYMVIDGKTVIIGLPERSGGKEPTRKGYKLPSESLAMVLKDVFEKQWTSGDSESYDTFARRTTKAFKKRNQGASDELISNELKIDTREVRRLLK